jgi:hypothetical protein
MVSHIIKNVTDGPKVLNSRPVMLLSAGADTIEAVEISEDELDQALLSGWFEIVKPAKVEKTEAK